MNVCEMGSADWWLVVESTPDNEEAIDLLNRYKARLCEVLMGQKNQNEHYGKLTRANNELKRRNRLLNNGMLCKTIKEFLGEDEYQEFLTFKILKEAEAKP